MLMSMRIIDWELHFDVFFMLMKLNFTTYLYYVFMFNCVIIVPLCDFMCYKTLFHRSLCTKYVTFQCSLPIYRRCASDNRRVLCLRRLALLTTMRKYVSTNKH